MKTIRSFGGLLLIMVLGMLIFSQCNEEPAPEANAIFTLQDADPDNISVEQTITVVFEMEPLRSTEHLVLYTGTPGKEYDSLFTDTSHSVNGEVVSGNKYDIVYTAEGTYKLTAVATTYGEWGEEVDNDVYSITVTVTDGRTNINSFGFDNWDAEGRITEKNEIIVEVIEIAPIDSLVANFKLVADSAELYIGSNLQESGVTANDFTSDVTYTVKAPDGSTSDYTVKVNTVAASTNNNFKFTLINFPEAKIVKDTSGTHDTITVRMPWGAETKQNIEYSIHRDAKIIFENDTTFGSSLATINDISSPSAVHVIAQNRDTATYIIKADFDAFAITSFMFKDIDPALEADFDPNNNVFTYPVLYTVDTTSMVAYFDVAKGATVTVDGVTQTSGETVNNFSDTVSYVIKGEDESEVTYDVIVNTYGP
jgi:hypothetical protein